MGGNLMPKEPELEKIREMLYKCVEEDLNKPANLPEFSQNIQAFSAYLTNYDTQRIIKWNRILAGATVILAIATVLLVILTYLKS